MSNIAQKTDLNGVVAITGNQHRIVYDSSSPEKEAETLQMILSADNGVAMPSVIEKGLDELRDASDEMRKEVSVGRRPYKIHWKTKNKSFIKVHKQLVALGIENNTFFLRLYDAGLEKINPYQKGLPLEIQLRIAMECIINPWYYLREISRMPKDGCPVEIGGGTAYRLDRNNLATWYLFLNSIDHYASKPRQQGKTQDAMNKINYAYHFGTKATTMSLFGISTQGSQENLARIKVQRDMMPPYLQMRVAFDEESAKELKETDNIRTMKNPVNMNKIMTLPRATTQQNAVNMGRGYTTAIENFDEFDFMNYNIDIINASVYAYETARKNSIESGALACRIFTSTPGDLDNQSGEEATNFINGYKRADGTFSPGMVIWKDEYLDMDIEAFKEIVYSKNYNGIVFVEHSWKQLGLSQQWYEKQCQNARYDKTVISREIELKRIRGNSRSPFDPETLYFISNNEKIPIFEDDLMNQLNPILFYEKLNRKYPYLVTVDPSEGLRGDNHGITVINPYTLKVAAEYKSNTISQYDLYILLCTFFDKYCPNPLIIVENNRGRELLNYFYYSRSIPRGKEHWIKYKARIYYDSGKMKTSYSTDKNGYRRDDSHERRALGISTTSNRTVMIQLLEDYVRDNKKDIQSRYLIDDICGLIRTNTGRIEAGPGKHDDIVMSFLFGLYVYKLDPSIRRWGITYGLSPEDEDSIKSKTAVDKLMGMYKYINSLPEDMREQFGDMANAIRANLGGGKKEHSELQKAIVNAKKAWNDTERHNLGAFEDAEDIEDPFGLKNRMEGDIRPGVYEDTVRYNSYNAPQTDFDIEDYL